MCRRTPCARPDNHAHRPVSSSRPWSARPPPADARRGGHAFDLAVTVSSPYDSPERYADGWRVLAPDGTELATHTLLHDHAGEQLFTRTQAGVDIPADIDEVIVEGRDQRYGYGGSTAIVAVPHDAR